MKVLIAVGGILMAVLGVIGLITAFAVAIHRDCAPVVLIFSSSFLLVGGIAIIFMRDEP